MQIFTNFHILVYIIILYLSSYAHISVASDPIQLTTSISENTRPYKEIYIVHKLAQRSGTTSPFLQF